ncbi:hypothetical protein BC830DRAFT_1096896 [Chytriomyces sp. MP71]|nr:hypothetical protein BC830DRAFT_1096896 [Chytriomyces sp. MP71]
MSLSLPVPCVSVHVQPPSSTLRVPPLVEASSSAVASPAVPGVGSAEQNRITMENRISVVMDLLQRTLRLAATQASAGIGFQPQMGGASQLGAGGSTGPFALPSPSNSLSLPSLSSSNSSETSATAPASSTRPIPFAPLKPSTSPQTAAASASSAASVSSLQHIESLRSQLVSLWNELVQLTLRHQQLVKSYSNSADPNNYKNRQRTTHYQKLYKQNVLQLGEKRGQVEPLLAQLRAVDPPAAQTVERHFNGFNLESNLQHASLMTGSLFGDERKSPLPPPNSKHSPTQQDQPLPQPQASLVFQQQRTPRAPMTDQESIILRRLSILVASAFSVAVDPFGTHFLLHALILLRRVLFPSTPHSADSTAPAVDTNDLRSCPVSLYLTALTLVEAQLRDGQTSLHVWRKWLAHAMQGCADPSLYPAVCARLTRVKRDLLHALDHGILVSCTEYDAFLKVFRGCLSARNGRTFTASYASNPNLRIGGSEGFGVMPLQQRIAQKQQQQQQGPGDRLLSPGYAIRHVQSYAGAGLRSSPSASGQGYVKSPLAAASSLASVAESGSGSIYTGMNQVGSPVMESSVGEPVTVATLPKMKQTGLTVPPFSSLLFASKRVFVEDDQGERGPVAKRPFRLG